MNPIPPNYPNGMIPPGVPPQAMPPQYPGYPITPYPMYPGLPPYNQIPPQYPGVPPYGGYPYPGYPSNSDDGSRNKKYDSKGNYKNRGRDDRHRKKSRDRFRDDDPTEFEPSNLNASPIHTVFYCNIPYEVSSSKFEKFASQYGEVSNIFSVFNHGFAFATYNDIRDAQKAVESTDDFLDGRRIKRAFAYRPPSHARKNPCDCCSTVLVTSLEDVTKITEEDVVEKMREFGEIRGSNQDRPRKGEFVVKFFKLSDAKEAVAHNGLDLKRETLNIEFLPDEDVGEDPETAPKCKSGKGKKDKHKRRRDYSDSDDSSDSQSSKDDKPADQMMQMPLQMPPPQWPNYNMPLQQPYQQPLYPQQQPLSGSLSQPPPQQPPLPAQQPPSSQPPFGNPQQFGF